MNDSIKKAAKFINSVFLDSSVLPVFRTGYNYDTLAISKAEGLSCPEKTLTQQQFKDEVDVNEIMRRFNVTGQLPVDFKTPQYGDFTGIDSYESALNAVIAARDSFMELPAHIRDKFNNDPQQLLEFISDNDNYEEARSMGFLDPNITSSEVLPQNKVNDASGDPPEGS